VFFGIGNPSTLPSGRPSSFSGKITIQAKRF
jgi:hypothetical protein